MEIHKDFFSVKEAVFVTSIKKSSLYNYIADGKLETRRIGGRTVILASSLKKLMAGGVEPAIVVNPRGMNMRVLLKEIASFISQFEKCEEHGEASRDLIEKINIKLR